MTNEFKELNTINIKRPAVVMVRKPFANNEEMTDELQRLLLEYVTITKKTISTIVGKGKLRAVYYNQGPGYPMIEDTYTKVPFFQNSVNYTSPSLKPIPVSVGDKGTAKVSYLSGSIVDMRYTDTFSLNQTKELYISPESDENYDLRERTYTCWILDDAYEIPDVVSSSSSVSSYSTNFFKEKKVGQDIVSTVYGLNPDVVEKVTRVKYSPSGIDSAELLSSGLGTTKEGQKILKNNTVYSVYDIIVRKGVQPMCWMTKADLEGDIQLVEKSNYRVYQEVNSKIHNQENFFKRYEGINDIVSKNYVVTIKNFLPEGDDNLIDSNYKVTHPYTESGYTVFYHPEDGTLTCETDTPYGIVLKAYISFCVESNIQINGAPDSVSAFSNINRVIPIKKRGETTTSGVVDTSITGKRYITDTGITLLTSVNTGSSVTRITIPGEAITDLANSFGGASTQTKVVTSQVNKIDVSYIPTIKEFKKEYYYRILKNYVFKKYEKLKPYEDKTVVQYPSNFYNTAIDLLNKNSIDDFIELCELVLFNTFTGFYIVNQTDDSEQISKYYNTEVYPEYLSDDTRLVLDSLGISPDSINEISNKDVSSIVISRQVMGKSTFSLVLKNLNEKYTIKKSEGIGGIGSLIFEPMDEVSIYLPTVEDKLVLSFKGYLNSAESINVNGYHSIIVKGECPIKKLSMVRTNVRPSLSNSENSNTIIHPFIVPQKFFDSIEQWSLFMYIQALTFYSSMLEPYSRETSSLKICSVKNGKPQFYDTLLTFLWYKISNDYADQTTAANALENLIQKYVSSIVRENGKPLSESVEKDGILDLRTSFVKSSKDGVSENYRVTYYIYAQRKDKVSLPFPRTLVSQVLGTRQPAFVLGTKDINIIFSDYQTNLQILLDTAEKFNFFLYSNKEGVVQFRPPQIDLSLLSIKNGIIDENLIFKNNNLSYEIKSSILSEQTTDKYQSAVSDEKLVTWLSMQGDSANAPGYKANSGLAVVVQNKPLSLKYGLRSQMPGVITGIGNVDALFIYGLSLMDRQNKSFLSATAGGLGYGDMDINETVYSPTDNVVYLREGLTLNYSSGQSFTHTSSLNWGRKPLFRIDDSYGIYSGSNLITEFSVPSVTSKLSLFTLNAQQDNISFGLNKIISKLLELYKKNEITVAYYNQLKFLLNSVKSNAAPSSLLSTFIFNGYVWDGVSSISFEDLSATSVDAGLGRAASGFEFALGIVGNKTVTIEQINERQKKLLEENEAYVLNGTGTLVCTVLTNLDNTKTIYVTDTPL